MHDSSSPTPATAPPVSRSLGPIADYSSVTDGLFVRCAAGVARLTFLADGLLRVELAPGTQIPDTFSYALDDSHAWNGPDALDVVESDTHVALRTDGMEARIDRATGQLSLFSRDGRPVLEDVEAPTWTASHVTLTKRLRSDERVLGLGDKTATLDRRGGRYEHWNTDAFAFMRDTDPIYKSIPFVLGITAGEMPLAYGLFVDTPARSTFDVGAAESDRLCIEAETQALTYYVFHADTPVEIVQHFTRLTGPMPMLPKWALGYHQCRYSYRTADEIMAVARGFRERGIPCDTLYFDIHYMDEFRVFTWDRQAFPDPAGLLAELRAMDFRTVVMVDPGIKSDDPDYEIAREGLEKKMFCLMPDGEPATGDVWPGACYFPDFTDPDARRWWGEQHRALVDDGVDGVWNDMNEPAVFDTGADADDEVDVEANAKTLPDEVRHDYEGHGADHALAHNVYGMQMVRATYDGLKALRPNRRPFVITRAAYPGTQRWATGWTGDNSSTWDHLRLALQQCLSLNASGFAFVGADVGGFIGAPSGELLARWTQLGALTPLFRNHSGLDTPPQEPWQLGPEVERICRAAIELRYRLLPYLYTTLAQATDGLPMMRALALAHPDDETVRADSPAGFYVGGDLLAYPVLNEGQTEVEVYLPENRGGWYDFWTGAHFAERSTQRFPVELDTLPLFVRAGAVLPLGPVRRSTADPVDKLTLRVYPRVGSFSSELYDDAGDGWEHLDGGFHRVRFSAAMKHDRLSVGVQSEGTFSPEWTRWQIEVVGKHRQPRAVLAEGTPVTFDVGDSGVTFDVTPGTPFTIDL